MMPWPTTPQPPAPTLTCSQALRWVRNNVPARVNVWDEGEMICCGMGKMVSTIRYGPGLTERELTEAVNAVRRDLGLPAPPRGPIG